MDETGKNQSGSVMILLFSFLFGALMTVVYIQPIKEKMYLSQDFLCCFMLALISLACIASASLNGLLIFPCVMLVEGAASALIVDYILEAASMNLEKVWAQIIFLLCVLPLAFLVSSWGINCSAAIRSALHESDAPDKRLGFISHILMLLGFITAFTLCRHIIIT